MAKGAGIVLYHGTDANAAALTNLSAGELAVGSDLHTVYTKTNGASTTTKVGDAAAFASASANRVWATPDGSAGTPTFRALVSGDIPDLSATYPKASWFVNAVVASDVSVSSTTFANVTGLSFAIGVGETWTAELHLVVQASGTQGVKFQFTGPASPSRVLATVFGVNKSTTPAFDTLTAFSSPTSGVYVVENAVDQVHLTLSVTNGSNAGTVQLQFGDAVGTNTNTVKAGSYMTARRAS